MYKNKGTRARCESASDKSIKYNVGDLRLDFVAFPFLSESEWLCFGYTVQSLLSAQGCDMTTFC